MQAAAIAIVFYVGLGVPFGGNSEGQSTSSHDLDSILYFDILVVFFAITIVQLTSASDYTQLLKHLLVFIIGTLLVLASYKVYDIATKSVILDIVFQPFCIYTTVGTVMLCAMIELCKRLLGSIPRR